ncbi:hypothetical protein H6P81_020161 [Aristolochia fimbriata]|uniref:Uncharacterized protein n=1 Tax=Aristolochia fimbriata TaxID=158543 RepID=A0AAV7DWN0_ARIFI|nr:hypothetical protein H6P81_020161 [Aristolochia fimbriata]
MAVATVVIFLALFSPTSFSGSVPQSCGECVSQANTKKPKENAMYDLKSSSKRDGREVIFEDYHLIDPAPSSKAAIKTGPVEHGSPFRPYIPPATPPSHPKKGPYGLPPFRL